MSDPTGPAFSTTDRPRVGPFELERLLGRGGMAETFVAVRRGPGGFEQRVCLKRILPELARDPNMVRLFLDEARNTASLRHSNIVQVIDFGTDTDQHYLALELVDGMDLHRLLDRLPDDQRGLPAELVTHIAIELSAALDYAHNAPNLAGQRGIFHRDLSPSNILISNTGDLKLTDFGVAKAAGQARATAAGVVRGKVEYMAPEYGMGGEYDARCDQFGLGVLLFEALTGARPYLGNSQGEVLHRARQGFHKPLHTLTGHVPPQLADTIQRMIRPKGEQRFEHMADVTKALLDIAPGPRGRVALAQLVSDARAGRPLSVPPPNAANEFAATMVSTPDRAVAAPASPISSSPPGARASAPIKSDPPLSTPAVPVRRVDRRTLWALLALVGAGIILVLLSLRGGGDRPSSVPVGSSPPRAASSGQGSDVALTPETPAATGNAGDELPLGVDPPPVPLLAPPPTTVPSGGATRTPGDSTQVPSRTPTKQTPHELIHRQKHDLLKPKDW